MRRDIIHKLQTVDNVISLNRRTKDATTFFMKELILPTLDIFTGRTQVPVLTLYSKGWNDYRIEVIKILNSMKKSL